jgi:DTW domain-containing protein YfiP
VTPLTTATRLVLLQHPRERDVAIGTARMASLCLTNSELHVGVDWRNLPALADPTRQAILLYPGEGALDIAAAPPAGPVTLVVVDGTWSQTKTMVRENPCLAALPRYAFVPPRPSEYRIRKEPNAASVATIEALVHVLAILEGGSHRFDSLLAPFRAMIDFQVACEERLRGGRERHAAWRARTRRHGVPRALTERAGDVVCVAGAANSWPRGERADELIQWVACRPATGETFSFVVRPEGPLADKTAAYTGLDESTLIAGGSVDQLFAAWGSFVRDSDLLCAWGRYELELFSAAGGFLPASRVDLRLVARNVERARGPLPPSSGEPLAPGRAGRKLRTMVDLVAAYS